MLQNDANDFVSQKDTSVSGWILERAGFNSSKWMEMDAQERQEEMLTATIAYIETHPCKCFVEERH